MARVYGPLVYRWTREGGLQPEDAADVVQEVFRSLIGAIERFDGKRADFGNVIANAKGFARAGHENDSHFGMTGQPCVELLPIRSHLPIDSVQFLRPIQRDGHDGGKHTHRLGRKTHGAIIRASQRPG